ncbi:MAG: hypothetical protein AAGI01_02855 [Myxococcota bacterium]
MTPTRLAIAACTVLAICSSPSLADALDGRIFLGASGNAARPGTTEGQLGPGAQLGISFELSEFWSVTAGADANYHFGRSIADDDPGAAPTELSPLLVSDAWVGATYALDVFRYIPYVGLSLVGYATSPPSGPNDTLLGPDLGTKLTLGLVYRPTRAWSISGAIEAHSSLLQLGQFSLYSQAVIHVGYHFRL